jgi:hypothetical protein
MFRHFYGQGTAAQDSESTLEACPADTCAQQHAGQCNIHAMSEAFSQLVPSKKFSMASIQVYLMQHKRDPSAALAQAAQHFQSASL